MTATCELFAIPSDVAFSPSQRQIRVSLAYTAAVDESGKLTLYSQSARSVEFTLEGVLGIKWIE